VVEAGAIPLLVGWLTPSWLTNLMSSERQLLTFRWALQTITHSASPRPPVSTPPDVLAGRVCYPLSITRVSIHHPQCVAPPTRVHSA
jgi:hypothetical protein